MAILRLILSACFVRGGVDSFDAVKVIQLLLLQKNTRRTDPSPDFVLIFNLIFLVFVRQIVLYFGSLSFQSSAVTHNQLHHPVSRSLLKVGNPQTVAN